MRRVVVVGGLGLFGRAITRRLAALGIESVAAARSAAALPAPAAPAAAPVKLDADDPASIGACLHPGDLVIDAAGPFQRRSTALLEAAIAIGFDLIDINDNLAYAERTWALERSIAAAGIRVLPSASSVSAIAAATIRHAGIHEPVRVTTFLAPASRHTANPGSALSLIRSVGRPVRVLHAARLQTLTGWSQAASFAFPAPIGPVRGRLFESADAVNLPRIWPSLHSVEMYVDTNTPGVNRLLAVAARSPFLRGLMEKQVRAGTWLARLLGSSAGGIGFAIEDANQTVQQFALLSGRDSFEVAVAPAVLAAEAIVTGRFPLAGLVPPDQHTTPPALFTFLGDLGIQLVRFP